MSSIVVVDDQAMSPTDARRPLIQYSPLGNWRPNELCLACALTSGTAMERVYNTTSQRTWMYAWWETERRLLTASFDFQGTSIAAYFIFFWRSEDPNSRGDSSLSFYIDNRLELETPIVSDNFQFELDSSPRTLMFQQSNLSPDVSHNLRIAWTHNGNRPRVALGLDSIEYTPSPGATIVTNPGGSTTDNQGSESTMTPLPGSQQVVDNSKRIATIVAPTVVCSVLLIAGLIGLFLWQRRRKARSQSVHYDPSVPTSEGRRYPHLTATPYNPPSTSTVAAPLAHMQVEPFQLPMRGTNDGSSQITAPSGYAYTSSGTDYSSTTYPTAHEPQAFPPAYADGGSRPSGYAPVRKS